MERSSGWIIWVHPQEMTTLQSYLWCAHTINNDDPQEIAYGDTANEAIGALVGKLTKYGAATIREIHTRDEQGKTVYPVGA